jgi:cell wall-associated NlpC family hydrolase
VTDVEPISTARTGGRTRLRYRAAALAGAVITAATSIGIAAPGASADPIAAAKAQAAQIAAQVAADGAKLDVLSQQYEAAQAKVGALQAQITQTKATIAADQDAVAADQANLRAQALEAYMTGGDASGLENLFTPAGNQAAASEYRSVASGNVSNAVDALHVAETKLSDQQNQLQGSENQAAAALAQVDASRRAAEATMGSEQSALRSANGQVAALIAQQQAAEEAAAHAAYLARLAAQRSVVSNVPANGAAGKAVAAAESQLGVPYHYGMESPGVGFDCSGLTQWAWGQAGVGIPRTAAAQYDAITHIPLSAMHPGDLVFWDEGGTIGHVAIYIGNGNVIHAPSTGSTVRVQAIWSDGLVGAGRP